MISFIRLALVLAIICCGAALSLSKVYIVTKEPIAYQKRLRLIKAVKAVLPLKKVQANVEITDNITCKNEMNQETCKTVFKVKEKEKIILFAYQEKVKGYGGDISLIVGVSPEKKITGVQVIHHSETPGLGANIKKESFLSQFANLNAEDSLLELKKKGGIIDQVTGATISSEAVILAVKQGASFIANNLNQLYN